MKKTKQYLDKTLSKNGKYLLALSGGPDSMALFQLLLEGEWDFHICHVDHGWRKESAEEANILENMAKMHSIPFYLHKMDPREISGENLEDAARKARHTFFKEEYEKGDFDALIMGHHADDQVETILKRIFEGSSLSHISGMQSDITILGMRLLRPLLDVFKSEIIDYLSVKNMSFFSDATNSDPKFLRARMRREMIPYLEESFGKGIKNNILLLGKRIEECMHSVQEQVESKLLQVQTGPLGHYILTSYLSEKVESEALLRRIFEKEKIGLSSEEVQRLIELIKNNKDQKKVTKSDWQMVIEKEHLFVIRVPKAPHFELEPLPSYRAPDGWRGIWNGSGAIFIPEEGCSLGPPQLGYKLQNGMELKEWYRIHKVPVFFRSLVPVIWKDGRIVGECLTGKSFMRDEPVYANHLLTLKCEWNNMDA
jgi:tRNA(Ile)-lysidine synthase